MTPTRRIDFRRLEPGLSERFDILCLDTEFTRLPLPKEGINDWARITRVLSVGIAAVSGYAPETLYVKRRVDRGTRKISSPFVVEQVLPVMGCAPADLEADTDAEIGEALRGFQEQRRYRTGLPAVFAVDWSGDAYVIETVTGEGCDWLLLDDLPEIQRAFDGLMPEGRARHNALHDALMVRDQLRSRTGMSAGNHY